MFGIQNLRVAHRLALGFGLVSAILAVTCSVAAWNSVNARRLAWNELAPAQRDYEVANEMLNGVLQQDVLIRNIGLTSSVPTMHKYASAARALSKRTAELITNLLAQPRPAGELDLLRQVRDVNAKCVPLTEDAMQMALMFQPDEVIKVINGQLGALSTQRSELVARFTNQKKERAQAAIDTIAGNASTALNVLLVTGVVGLLCAVLSAWLVARSISTPLRDAVSLANRVAQGDLTASLESTARDEIGELLGALGRMATNLRGVIGTMRQSSMAILNASTEIANGNLDLSSRTELQASSLEATASTVADIADAVQRNADAATRANDLAVNASSVATLGGDRVAEVTATMNEIADSSRRMADIVGVIDGIAFQTNVLALNAAVEAARAGAHGRGFAVVASEVRALSMRSSTAAKEIKALISVNVDKVKDGTRLVCDAAATMSDIVTSTENVASIVSDISTVTKEQAVSLEKVNKSVRHIDGMTQQNAALVEQATAAASSLKDQAHVLDGAVGAFRTAAAA